MSDGLKKLFQQNKQTTQVSKYLSQTSADSIGDGIESAADLSESIRKRDAFIPAVDYGDPAQFVKFGSAEDYYNNSFNYIADYYPYDGSSFEKTKFYNDLNPLESYVFNSKYPKSTGYIVLNPSWGTKTAQNNGYGVASATDAQYVQVKGGPQSGTFYSLTSNRTSNLEFGGPSGSTVEFFYKKIEGMPAASAQGEKQVVFDLWNGVVSSSAGHGRMRVEVFSGSEDRFHVTMLSGTTGYFTQSVPTTGGLDLCSGSWHHYAFSFDTSTTAPTLNFYVDGVCLETNITASGHQAGEIGLVTGSLIANLGSLRAAISGSLEGTSDTELTYQGYGKLSASLDEFRFWKTNRNPEQVGRYWFTNVDGGSNKYDANKDLGVYFKFNEGITGVSDTDSVVLDYSGRISNGTFVQYNPAYSRNLGSAINDLNITNIIEAGDPIVRKTNSLYVDAKSQLQLTGSNYDYNNNGRLLNQMPSWIIEEDEAVNGELRSLLQIISNYFDTAYIQVSEISKIKNMEYMSGSLTGSAKNFPHNDRILDNLGLETPEIFENISALSQFKKRDEQILFDQELVNTKNQIYKNIYNNLNSIFKRKGTPDAIRNFIRCLGVGEEIISLNTYANNSLYYLTSSYKVGSSTKKYVDFSGLTSPTENRSTVYQYYQSSNPNSYGIINGSGSSTNLQEFAFTMEGEFLFPDRSNIDNLSFTPYEVVTSSLFGYHTPQFPTPTSTDLTWIGSNYDYGLRVAAIKSPATYAKIFSPAEKVRDAYFAVFNRANEVVLTSSVFREVYDNKKWNLALSVKPKKYPFAEGVLGTSFSGGSNLEYEIELYGVNYHNGEKVDSFSSVADLTYTTGSAMINSAKRIFMGAHRTNFNGSLLTYSDVRATSCRYWTDYINNEVVDHHARDAYSFGTLNPYRNVYSFQTEKPNVYIPQIQTLALNWDFANLSSSNALGQFEVSDFSSGSLPTNNYPGFYQDGSDTTFSDINLRQHTGRGDFFTANSTPIQKQYIYTEKLQVPDYATSDDMVKVLASDDEYFNINYRPQNLFYAIEKSLYKNISERMLQLFASIEEYNNLIGEPVNKYRPEYKNLEKMREIFFRNVENTPDFDKYLRFYKWLDVSMSEMIEQLMPASVAKADSVRTIIENHILERPKIKYGYPSAYKTRFPSPVGVIRNNGGVCPDEPGWKFNHAPLSTLQKDNCFWWETKSERDNVYFSSSDAGVINTRNAVLTAVKNKFSSSNVVCFSGKLDFPLVGGINQHLNKRRNIRDIVFDNFEIPKDCGDELDPNKKTSVYFRGTKNGTNFKGALVSPFTVVSGSNALGGYQTTLAAGGLTDKVITNLHEDSIHPFLHSVPLQGPFTEKHVGGIQARHVNPMLTSYGLRKEANRLIVGGGKVYLDSITTGSSPKGQYLRGMGSKAPLNVSNIKTFTGSIDPSDGARSIGNYTLGYQVFQTNDRSKTNVDFVFNNSAYYSGSIPTAFLTTPAMRNSGLGRTGSLDYAAPRQRANRRTTEVIFVNRFSSPGSTLDSRQQFRDVASDQMSPNNALPFRNIPVRKTFNKKLKTYTGWGGFVSSSGVEQLELYGATRLSNLNSGTPWTQGVLTIYPATASIHKTQRNTTERLAILAAEASAGSGVTVGTGSLRDNAFFQRPIPAGDRTEWFFALSGTNSPGNALMNQFVLSSSRYPENITITTSSLLPLEINSIQSTRCLFSNSSGQTSYIWSRTRPGFVPWSQTRTKYAPFGNYYNENNSYEIFPAKLVAFNEFSRIEERTEIDRAGNSITYKPLKTFREAPVTSRYKPMLHHIKSYAGTPNKSEYSKPIEVSLKYSYGNFLMGFANRNLNLEYSKDRQSLDWASGKIKRPYEILRDNYISDVPKEVDGIDIIRLTNYSETVYPKEIYTYLSASRGRTVFRNNFWRDDKRVSSVGFSTAITSLATIASETNIQKYNRQVNRISSSFVTSQGYLLQRSEQISYDEIAGAPATGNGSGSIWPMDSYLYSDYTSSLGSIVDSGGNKVGLAAASTLPPGELMLTSFGEVKQNSSAPSSRYERAGVVSAQYIYSAPAMNEACTATPATAATATITSLVAPAAAVAATIKITVPSTFTDTCLDTGTLTLDDTGTACVITFDKNTDQVPTSCPGTLGYNEVGSKTQSTIAIKIADSVNAVYGTNFTAVANSPATGDVTITASPAGTAGNSYTVQWTQPSGCTDATESLQIDDANATGAAQSFSGGAAAVSIEDETITIQFDDGAGSSGTHTMTFKEDGTASSSTIIDVSTATTVGAVATEIGATITAASSGIAINVSSVAGAVVNLVAATAGTHQNGKQIAGSAESAGTISAADFSGGAPAGVSCIYDVKPRSPGGTPSRPAWIAPSQRRTIEGPNRSALLPARTPSYNSYGEYASDVRAKGQEYTIVPEYRMSEHITTYQNNNNANSIVEATLDITGANSDTFNSSFSHFYNRYVNSDRLQYLDQFMNTNKLDFSFNSFPKQLKVESDSVVKLLPYDGFYPMDRSLQIANLFSSSYNHVFSGASGSVHHAMRANLRPFFAPGIFYNSIKSGIAVDYPVRRTARNEDQFLPLSAQNILNGCLSGALDSALLTAGEIPGSQQNIEDRRRFTGNNPATVGQGQIDFTLDNTNKMFWGDRLPFESIFSPETYLAHQTVLSDINEVMFNDVSGSIKGTLSNLYKKAVSNFMASTPEFFLSKKTNLHGSDGYLTKFVGRLPAGSGNPEDTSSPNNLRFQFGGSSTPSNTGERRATTIYASSDNVYIMEVGITKTDRFNMYNNPYAYGVPTATGSGGWDSYDSGSLGSVGAERPSGSSWPQHRGEFAPFTPPYFYGTSTARIMFAPQESRQYQLSEIIGESAQNTYIEFVNESGSYYDFDIGSYYDLSNNSVTTSGTPPYGWNRAWQNRMDIDASISLTNVFAAEGGSITPNDPDKWVIMPKWECPILDFPNYGTTRPDGNQYSFSSSVNIGDFDESEGTFGMWHQYGVSPQQNEGVFMFIKDVDPKETELRLVGDPSLGSSATGQQIEVRKVPKWVLESGKRVSSLAELTGFDPSEVMRGGFQIEKAKRLGELGRTNEKQISEAILAMPYFLDKNGKPQFMTLRASPEALGVKIKEFRRKFTKYSLPPALASRLSILVPSSYPDIPDFINPFGGDDLDSTLQGVDFGFVQTPVVYLMEHKVNLSRQDLADMWQGVLPDVGKSLRVDLTAIDHYMPASGNDEVDDNHRVMPEILEKELDLGLPRSGIPRVDLLDISRQPNFSSNGFNIDIRWFVFKVKRRGLKSYTKLITNEVNGYSFSPYRAAVQNAGGNQQQQDVAAILQYADDNAINDPTFNWPQDYFSLVELNKLTITSGFRPDISKENQELEPPSEEVPVLDPGNLPPGRQEFSEGIAQNQQAIQSLQGSSNQTESTSSQNEFTISRQALENVQSRQTQARIFNPGDSGNNY